MGVREDRGIAFAADGIAAGLQHGREGVFLIEDGAPRKIFQPSGDVIAISPPQWSPIDKRAIFATAVRVDLAPGPSAREPDPAGDLFFSGPTRYTCWLQPEGKDARPVALFEATCDHPGLIAANLAIRWGPDGKEVFHVREVSPSRHALCAFDLQSKQTRQVFPLEAAALVFAWSPDHRTLAVTVAEGTDHSANDGTWVGAPGEENWWHVPGSEDLAAKSSVALERARASLASWSLDSKHFVLPRAQFPEKGNALYALDLVTPATQKTQEVVSGKEKWKEVRWRPDSKAFAALQEPGRLMLFRLGTPGASPLVDGLVIAFAGWGPRGDQIAYVTQGTGTEAERWAFLFIPDWLAQQSLHVRKAGDPGPGRVVLDGMQVTFPTWAPDGKHLSLWATFRPPYITWLSVVSPGSGDPALLLDPVSGELSWQPTNSREMEQVGHYYLRRHDHAEAWRWYERVRKAPAAAAASPDDDLAALMRSYCLSKLGRPVEAAAERQRFESSLQKELRRTKQQPQGPAGVEWTAERLQHFQDLFEAEAFLSADAAEDGEAFFRKALAGAKDRPSQLSKALVLSQFLLLNHKHEQYADLASAELLPRLLQSWPARPNTAPPLDAGRAFQGYVDALALLPLAADDFLQGLPEKQVRTLVERYAQAGQHADDDVKRAVVDHLLVAAYRRLGQTNEAELIQRRLATNPTREGLVGPKGVPGLIKWLRAAPALLQVVRELRARLGG
jgi:hypothetical protein